MTTEPPPNPLDSLNKSVIGTPDEARGIPSALTGFVMWAVAQAGDEFIPWGAAPKQRDKQLRDFITQETYLSSALGIVTGRNAAMSWEVTGDEATAEAAHDMLNNANHGGGWEEFITQTSLDLYTQDCGAFVELMREEDSPESPVIGVAHLDSARCFLTGQPEEPVWYQDLHGRYHPMKWYQVVQLLEQPSAITPASLGFFMKLQYSAVTRLLRSAQILRSIEVYTDEKISGRFTRGVHLLQGVSEDLVHQALQRSEIEADARGLMRYMGPTMVAATDPQATVGVATLDVAALPDGFSESEMIKNYITVLAMAFGTDYQEFAPLPGGNLGTSAQSEVLHAKSRGKGPGLFRSLIQRLMNLHGVLPSNVQFEWTEMDIEAAEQEATVAKMRAEERSVRIASGELTPAAARQIALDAGDLTEEVLDLINAEEEEKENEPPPPAPFGEGQPPEFSAGPARDMTTDVTIDGDETTGVGMRTVSPEPSLGEAIVELLRRQMAAQIGQKSFADSLIEIDSIVLVEDALKEAGLYDVRVDPVRVDDWAAAAVKALANGLKQDEPLFVGEGQRPEDVPVAEFTVPGPATRDERAGPSEDRLELEGRVETEIAAALARAERMLRQRWAAEPVPTG